MGSLGMGMGIRYGYVMRKCVLYVLMCKILDGKHD